MAAEMKGSSAAWSDTEIAQASAVAEEYGVDQWKVLADYAAHQAFVEDVRKLFADYGCAWPRTTLSISEYGGVLHYERPEVLDATLSEMPAIPALPVCPKLMPVGGGNGGDAA